ASADRSFDPLPRASSSSCRRNRSRARSARARAPRARARAHRFARIRNRLPWGLEPFGVELYSDECSGLRKLCATDDFTMTLALSNPTAGRESFVAVT